MDSLDIDAAAELVNMPRSQRVECLFNFEPFDYQAEVLDAEANRVLWLAGRQVGKTESASVVPADHALLNPGSDTLIAARFQETADELFRRTKAHLKHMGEFEDIGVTSPNSRTYEFDTGSRIMSRTLGHDGRQQRGKVPSCVVIEEAALVDREVYDQVLRPMFATHDDYELFLITTPRGTSGYVYEKWLEADDSDRWAAFHTQTGDNPLVSEEWLESERAEVDDLAWRQEYLGEFVDTGESYLPHSVVEPCVSAHPPERTGSTCWLGVDVARSGSDRSVYVSVDDEGNVFDIQVADVETLDQAVGRIQNLDDTHNYRAILVDENGLGGGVVDFSALALDNVEPVPFSSKSKQELYQMLKRTLEGQELSLPANDRLLNELTALQYDFTQHGILRVEAPPGGRDDYADALALAVRGWQQRSGPSKKIIRRGTPSEIAKQRAADSVGSDSSDSESSSSGRRRIVRRRSPGITSHGGGRRKTDREKKKDAEEEKRRYFRRDR